MKIQQLHKLFLASKGIVTDSRKITKGTLYFALKGANFNGNKFAISSLEKGANFAIIDEAIPQQSENCILVDDVLKTLQELANFHRKTFEIPFIAVTGSNGKTTTKELLVQVLAKKYKVAATKGNFNNHIGVPLTLLEIEKNTEIAIIEMGDNHCGEVAELCKIAEPTHGFITNIGKDHIEGFGDFENNIKAKKEIFDYLSAQKGIAFINTNDLLIANLIKNDRSIQTVFCGRNEAFDNLKFIGANPFIKYQDAENEEVPTKLIGGYNFENLQMAYFIGQYFKVSNKEINAALAQYQPNNNRSQLIEKNETGNTIILDAYNANPSSVEAALKSFAAMESLKPKIVVLGDMFELGTISEAEHQIIIELAEKNHFEKVLFCGKLFYHSKNETSLFFESKEKLQDFLKAANIKKSLFLIKGSRGIALETVVELL